MHVCGRECHRNVGLYLGLAAASRGKKSASRAGTYLKSCILCLGLTAASRGKKSASRAGTYLRCCICRPRVVTRYTGRSPPATVFIASFSVRECSVAMWLTWWCMIDQMGFILGFVVVVAPRDRKSWESAKAPATTELRRSSEAKIWPWDMLGLVIASLS